MQSVLDTHKDQIGLATTAADIERIVKAGKISAFLTIEGGHAIDDDLRVLRMYYRLGIRSMTLTHARNTNWADSSSDTPEHNGLTDFGKEVIRELNRLGRIVDLAHVSDKTLYDALAATTKAVIVSHSSMRAISNVPRMFRMTCCARTRQERRSHRDQLWNGFYQPEGCGRVAIGDRH